MENRRENGAGTDGPARLGVLIPAYEPGRGLSGLVRRLSEAGLPVVVVNDGSSAAAEPVFQELGGAVVLRHKKNRGKGRALKTGIAYMAAQGFEGVVTADADGQHSPEDILRVAEALSASATQLVLGTRDVSRMQNGQRTDKSAVPSAVWRPAAGHPDRPAGHSSDRAEPARPAGAARRGL